MQTFKSAFQNAPYDAVGLNHGTDSARLVSDVRGAERDGVD